MSGRDIERRTGVAGLQAADDFVRSLGDTAYNPAMEEDALRAAARATAEAAAATERGISAMGFLKAFDDEVARSYGPGSSWNDEQRAEWERDLRAGSVEAVERKFGSPDVHDQRAIEGLMLDSRRRETGKSIFTEQIEHAMDRHDAHSKERLPHMEAMREALVEDWERTHDPDGFNRSQRDGQGNEHGGEYEQPRSDR